MPNLNLPWSSLRPFPLLLWTLSKQQEPEDLLHQEQLVRGRGTGKAGLLYLPQQIVLQISAQADNEPEAGSNPGLILPPARAGVVPFEGLS